MNDLLSFAAAVSVLVVVLLGLLALLELHGDGYGHRTPPPSHLDWESELLPSRPYREG